MPTNPTVSSTGTFSLHTPGTYTVTCSDAGGCSISTIFTINGVTPILGTTVSPNNICAGSANVTFTASGANSGYAWSNGAFSASTTTTSPPTVNTTYTVTGSNAGGCTASATATLTLKPAPVFTVTPTPLNICIGSSATFTASGLPTTSFTWSAGIPTNGATIYPTTSNVYTVTATGSNNCTSTSTVMVNVHNLPPPPTYNLNNTCLPTILTITNPVGIGFTYLINGANGSFPAQSSPSFTLVHSGTYAITAVDAYGCSNTSTVTIAPCYKCLDLQTPNLNTIYVPSNSCVTCNPATFFATMNSGTPPTLGTPVVFDGTFTVDQNFNVNYAQLYFTPGSQLVLANGKTLNVNASILRSCGLEMWNGITADQATEHVNFISSELREATNGITINNNAILLANGSTFYNNGSSDLVFNNLTLNPYTGTIYNNTFSSQGAPSLLLPPFNMFTNTARGIDLINTANLTVGHPTITTLGNEFNNLNTGIEYTINPPFGSISTINIANNNFRNIHNFITPITDYVKVAHKYIDFIGAAVCGINYNNTTNANVNVTNNNHNTGNKQILNCDKGVILQNINTLQSNLNMQNVLMGSMNSSPISRIININNNLYNNVFYGIEALGLNNFININSNRIKTPINYIDAQIPRIIQHLCPIGINVDNYSNISISSTFNRTIDFDTINIQCVAGIGIKGASWNNKFEAMENVINFTTTFGGHTSFLNPSSLSGLWLQNNLLSTLKHNYVNGADFFNNKLAFYFRSSNGIYLDNCNNQTYECNQVYNVWNGFHIMGNNTTNTQAVQGNLIDKCKVGMCFERLGGTEGTFGQIGSINYDCNNQFGSYFFGLPISNNAAKIQRITSLYASPDNFYTSNGTIADLESFPDATLGLYRYLVVPNSSSYNIYNNSICMTPITYLPRLAQIGAGTDTTEAVNIATNNISYTSNTDVETFRNNLRLYGALALDSILRNSNIDLSTFYINNAGSDMQEVFNTNNNLLLLNDSLNNTDSSYLSNSLASIEASNEAIQSSFDFVNNERIVNDIYLKYATQSINKITAIDSIYIDSLANQCPAIAGTAVYKARTLYNLWNGAVEWDDQLICAMGGLYKTTGENWVIKQREDQMNNLQNPFDSKSFATSVSKITISPNPSNGMLYVQYTIEPNQKAKLLLSNALGEIIKEISLNSNKNKEEINLYNIPNGIYAYQYYLDGKVLQSGKLNIIK